MGDRSTGIADTGSSATGQGRFITLEGGEGTGKSTQLRLLANWLAETGISVIPTREPGGPHNAEAVRDLLRRDTPDPWLPTSEVLLHMAARSEHVAKVIRPGMDAGCWVVCDRFVDSTAAYQGAGQGLGRDCIAQLHRIAFGDLMPELTLILDAPVDCAFSRLQGRGGPGDRYERMADGFHERVRAAFLAISEEEPERCVVIDATQPEAVVAADIRRNIFGRFGVNGKT